jgi:hypothetical protein
VREREHARDVPLCLTRNIPPSLTHNLSR